MYTSDSVIYHIDLPAPAQFSFYYITYQAVVLLHDISLHRIPLFRRLLYDAHILYTCQRHIQRPWDRSSRQGQDVYVAFQLFDLLLVFYAEALFFIYDQKSQILKFDPR